MNTMPSEPIRSLSDLKAFVVSLVGHPLEFSDTNKCKTMTTVEGKVKTLLPLLKSKTGAEGWTRESRHYTYVNDSIDVSISISSAPGCVLLLAHISSLHRQNLAKLGL